MNPFTQRKRIFPKILEPIKAQESMEKKRIIAWKKGDLVTFEDQMKESLQWRNDQPNENTGLPFVFQKIYNYEP